MLEGIPQNEEMYTEHFPEQSDVKNFSPYVLTLFLFYSIYHAMKESGLFPSLLFLS